MNCRINYLYERFSNNPDFAAHLEKIELEIWNTLKNEGFPRFQYEGVNYFTLSPKMSKEYKQQMKVLQSLRDKFGSQELFLMKKLPPFDYSLIQVGMGKIEEYQRKIFEENKFSNKGQNDVVVREIFDEGAYDKFQKMKPRPFYLKGVNDARNDQSKDESIRERLFENSNKTDVRTILKEIIKNPIYSKIAKKLLDNVTDKTNLPVYLIPVEELDKEGSRGLYFPDKKIEIAENANYVKGKADGVVLYEIIHALTISSLIRGDGISNDWYKLWEYAEKMIKEDHYGLKNAEEFAAELFVNGKFIQTLKKYPPSNLNKYKNLWEEILNFFKNLLGFKNESLYDEAVTMLSNIIEQEAQNIKDYEYQKQIEEDFFKGVSFEYDENFERYNEIENYANTSTKLTTEQTNQIEDLKQSDPRWNKYSNEDIQRFIDSVFPDSKVKNIVYHGTNYKFEEFEKEYIDIGYSSYFEGFHFASNINTSLDRNISKSNNFKVLPILLNITNLKNTVDSEIGGESLTHWHLEIRGAIKNGYDGLIYDNLYEGNGDKSYVVFEPEQIYILSSDSAMIDFENFMKFEKSNLSKTIDFKQFKSIFVSKSSNEIENILIQIGKIKRKC